MQDFVVYSKPPSYTFVNKFNGKAFYFHTCYHCYYYFKIAGETDQKKLDRNTFVPPLRRTNVTEVESLQYHQWVLRALRFAVK